MKEKLQPKGAVMIKVKTFSSPLTIYEEVEKDGLSI